MRARDVPIFFNHRFQLPPQMAGWLCKNKSRDVYLRASRQSVYFPRQEPNTSHPQTACFLLGEGEMGCDSNELPAQRCLGDAHVGG